MRLLNCPRCNNLFQYPSLPVAGNSWLRALLAAVRVCPCGDAKPQRCHGEIIVDRPAGGGRAA